MFYQKNIQDILKECESSLEGLNDFQVKNHIAKYGKNELVEKKKDSPLVIFLKQFQDLLVIILIFAAIISGLSHQIESTFVIIAVIVLNALLLKSHPSRPYHPTPFSIRSILIRKDSGIWTFSAFGWHSHEATLCLPPTLNMGGACSKSILSA